MIRRYQARRRWPVKRLRYRNAYAVEDDHTDDARHAARADRRYAPREQATDQQLPFIELVAEIARKRNDERHKRKHDRARRVQNLVANTEFILDRFRDDPVDRSIRLMEKIR